MPRTGLLRGIHPSLLIPPWAGGGDTGNDGLPLVLDSGSLGGVRTVGLPLVLSVLAFGADPTGMTDSAPAFNAAIAELPASGGIVYAPAGNYRCNSNIVIGNGGGFPPTQISTRQGVVLQGAGVGGGFNGFAISSFSYGATRLFFPKGNGILIEGPLQGWGVQDLDLDGQSVASPSRGLLDICGAQTGFARRITFRNSTIFALRDVPVVATGLSGAGGNPGNCMHNRFEDISFLVPDVNGAGAIQLLDNLTDGSSTACYERFDNVTIVNTAPSTGHTVYGMYLQGAETALITSVHMTQTGAGAGGTLNQLVFNYSGQNAGRPDNNTIQRIDFGTNSVAAFNIGTPTGASKNRVYDIGGNGVAPNPNLPNLDWGGVVG